VARRAVIKSFAKINLFLDVICRRRDGYHNIETVFQTVGLSDMMEIEVASTGVEIGCDDPTVPTDESNLAYKAFLGLKEALGYRGGVRMRIQKNIPPCSGLGGGSSNAAATLVALNHLLGGGLSDDQLREVARDIGADVPFFISGGLAAAWQIGDKVEPLPALPESFIVLAVPRDVGVSTPAAYRMVAAPECEGPVPERLSECSGRLKACVKALDSPSPLSMNDEVGAVLHNSLEKPVFSLHPEIAELKALLLAAGAKGALMSGSGSAVFGLAESFEHAGEIERAVGRSASCKRFTVGTVDCGSELQSQQ
jgi:4-diphosphocytidyl-2-C-methyl-D-erythritol kinase